MLKSFLMWLSRLGSGHVMVVIKPIDGEIVFANTFLRFLKEQKFQGLRNLQNLSNYLQRPIHIYKPTNLLLKCSDCFTDFGEITPKSAQEDLEKIASKMNEETVFIKMSENPNLPWERIYLIYV